MIHLFELLKSVVGGSQNKITTLVSLLLLAGVVFIAYERFTASFRLGRLQREAVLLSQIQEIQAKGTNAMTPELSQLNTVLLSNASKTITENRFSLEFIPSKLSFSFDSLWKFLTGGILWLAVGVYFLLKKKTPDYKNTFWGYVTLAGVSGIAGLFVPSIGWPWFHLLIFPWLLIIGIFIALTPFAIFITNFQAARKKALTNTCINNLRQIDGAKQQWALENQKPDSATPTAEEIAPYLKDAVVPECPAGGVYTIGAVNVDPRCSTASHTLPKP